MATCITNGKFDLLHVGHFNLLMYCRRLVGFDGMVIVLLDSDLRIKEIEGRLPIFTEKVRQKQIEQLKLIDRFLVSKSLFFSTDHGLQRLMKLLRPDFLVKGSEWSGKHLIGSEYATQVCLYNAETLDGENKISSSSIIKTILDKYGKPSV